jgi:hypothetical protein
MNTLHLISLALAGLALTALTGCGGQPTASGTVDVWWADGAGSDTGIAYPYDPVLLRMAVAEYGDALPTGGWWTISQQPFGSDARLSDPWSQDTVGTFDTPGWYVLDYTVEYMVGHHTDYAFGRINLQILPTGAG